MRTAWAFALILGCTALQAQDAAATNEALRAGNLLYRKNEPGSAAHAYERAIELSPTDARGQYNLGNAQYRQKNYADAVARFEQAATQATDATTQARAYHNLGNAHLSQQKPEDAIKAYKEALKRSPSDEDTRYNMAYAQRMLKQQQQQQQKDQDEKKDDQQQEKKDQQEKPDDQQQKKDEPGKPDEQQAKQPQPQPGQMTKQEAERTLDALAHQERKAQEKARKKMRTVVKVPIEKDW